MLLKIGAVLAAIPMSLLAIVAGTGVVVVDVKQGGPDGHHIVVPVPILAGEVAAAFAPEKARHIDLAKATPYLPAAEEMLKALGESEDFDLVRVDQRDEHVLVRKHGPNLQVHVQEGSEQDVEVTVPISLARELVREARRGELTPADFVGLLRDARLTRLADVRQGDEHVRVTVW